MEYKKDLLKKGKKSVFRIILGISFFVVSISWVVARRMDDGVIKSFDWIYFGVMFLNGIVHTTEGFGFLFMGLFGKAFINIDEKRISFKPDIHTKEKSISWAEVASVEYRLVKFQFIMKNGNPAIFDLSKLEYTIIQDVKDITSSIARLKGISIL